MYFFLYIAILINMSGYKFRLFDSKPVGDLNDGGGKLLPVSYDSYVSRLHSFTVSF